ncbi:MAG: hypothetical protein K8R69_08500 [Deltaproteobacteria bacterium]|nr:hypothetical protein [Deltaproteobacteria bacterium]
MKIMNKCAAIGLILGFWSARAGAVDINLLNVNLGSPEASRAEQLYGNAYGFQPQQVTPALLGPAEEVPAIMQVAQAAGTVPMSVMLMRKMGMSYSRILQTFAVAPLVGMGTPVTDSYYIQTNRTNFLQNILHVDPLFMPNIPMSGPEFTRFIVYPTHKDYGYWMPPGIAKKYGMWIPPGQAKKMGIWGGPGKSGWGNFEGEDDDDGHGHGHFKKEKGKDEGWKHEAKAYGNEGKGHGQGGGHGHGHHGD